MLAQQPTIAVMLLRCPHCVMLLRTWLHRLLRYTRCSSRFVQYICLLQRSSHQYAAMGIALFCHAFLTVLSVTACCCMLCYLQHTITPHHITLPALFHFYSRSLSNSAIRFQQSTQNTQSTNAGAAAVTAQTPRSLSEIVQQYGGWYSVAGLGAFFLISKEVQKQTHHIQAQLYSMQHNSCTRGGHEHCPLRPHYPAAAGLHVCPFDCYV